MIFKHDMIPQVHEMMSDVHDRLPLDAYPCVMKWHTRLCAPLQGAKCVVIRPSHRLLLLIAIVIARIVHVIVLGGASIENRMASGIPSAIANVDTTKEGYMLVNDNHLGMVAPQADTVTCVPHHLNIWMKPCKIFLRDQTV